MRVAVCGAGYVGLASAALLAHVGHDVRVLDIDERRIAQLTHGVDPIGEPGLAESLPQVTFTTSPRDAYRAADAILVTVGTPSDERGAPDLSQVLAAASAIAEHAPPAHVVIRSTVPVGTGDRLEREVLRHHPNIANPEFLREGHALADSLNATRIVAGGPSAEEVARALYGPVLDRTVGELHGIRPTPDPVPLFTMDRRSAELAKYAANAFLATKLSFVNEIANVAAQVGADIDAVTRVVGSDPRIGAAFLRPGIGWGGSCFPKDTRALDAFAADSGYDFTLLRAVIDQNNAQLRRFHSLVRSQLSAGGRRVGLLGLAFKAGTSDLRESPAIALAELLVKDGADVRAFDPAVSPGAPVPNGITIVPGVDAAADGADVLVVATEWPEFASLDFAHLRQLMRGDVVLDGRCIVDGRAARAAGLRFAGIGAREI